MLLQWVLVHTNSVFFALTDKKRQMVRILHSATKYTGKYGAEDHHVVDVLELIRECTEIRELMLVLIHPVKLKMEQKKMMVPNNDMEMW